MLRALLCLLAVPGATAMRVPGATAMRVAVFGGTGLVGSRVCRALVNKYGCDVLSLSRSGEPPTWADGEAWATQVQWQTTDAAVEGAAAAALEASGAVDAVVSCIGTRDVLALSASSTEARAKEKAVASRAANGPPNVQAAKAAKAAGAQKFVLVGVASDAETGYSGATPGPYEGKRDAADAARELFGDDAVLFGPHRVYTDEGANAQVALAPPLPVGGRLAARVRRWR